jgi:hypothetical protein
MAPGWARTITTPQAAALVLASLVATASLCSAAPAAHARGSARAAAAGPPAGGVNLSGYSDGASLAFADTEIAAARRLNAKLVRAGLSWSSLEPARRGQIDARALAFTDRLVADAAADGIGVIFTVSSTPCWASSAPAALLKRCSPAHLTQANAWPPRRPSDYASVMAYLAGRYGSRLAALEVWNEPDQANQLYFAGPHKVARYAAILRAAYPAVKRANAAVPVLGGSLVGSNGSFLRGLYAAGIKGYYDGLAVHFYNLVLGSVRAIHQVQLANGDRTPLWLDEFGWTSCFPRHRVQEEQPCVTRQVQAANISDIYRSLAHAPYVAAVVLYQLQDTGGESFGVQTAAGVPKTAFGALARVLAAPFGPPRPVKLALRRRGAAVQAVGSGPVGDFMQLEAFAGGVLRYRALFLLDRFDRYSIRLPAALGNHGVRVRVFQYWAGASGAARARI